MRKTLYEFELKFLFIALSLHNKLKQNGKILDRLVEQSYSK